MITAFDATVANNYVDSRRRERAAEEAAKSPTQKRADKILEIRWMFVGVLCNRSVNWQDDDDRMVWLKRALEDMRLAWFEAKEGNTEQAADTIMKLVAACPVELDNMSAILYALANEIEGHPLECECTPMSDACPACKAAQAERELSQR